MNKNILIFALAAAGALGVFFSSDLARVNRTDALARIKASTAQEDLYFTAHQTRLMSSDLRPLIADWYWISSLQYMGNKILTSEGRININDLRSLDPRLLYPMLETAQTLDPQFMAIYSYGAAVLPAIDTELAIKLLEKGIEANPTDWRLFRFLGQVLWQSKNYERAATAYEQGAVKPGAPPFMRQMATKMRVDQAASNEVAKETYRQMIESGAASDDDQSRQFAVLRYKQIESLEMRERLDAALTAFRRHHGRCANRWREIHSFLEKLPPAPAGAAPPVFGSEGEPIDPTGVPFVLITGRCVAGLSDSSPIPKE